jgi:thymidylate synthase (FAD)
MSNNELKKKIVKWGHWSVLEFADATFMIEDISRACTHQLVRHRHFSFMEESQRYCNVSENGFIVPEKFKDDYKEFTFIKSKDESVERYNELIDLGAKKEDARFILPQGISTRIVMKGNFRVWKEFFHKRCSMNAQWEIREVAWTIRDLLTDETEKFLWEEK